MAKIRTSYFCQNCGAESAKWIGKCPSCGEWNTYVEEVIQKEDSGRGSWHQGLEKSKRSSVPKKLIDVSDEKLPRLVTHDQELDRVLGGGIRSEEHTSELQSRPHLVCRLLLEKKK